MPAINQTRVLRAPRPGEATTRAPETMVAMLPSRVSSPSELSVTERTRSVTFAFVTTLWLPPDRAAAASARRFVSDTMREWGCDDLIPDAELLVSELVTNAVLHARSATRVTIERGGTTLRVSVCDDSRDRPHLRDGGPEAVSGRGLVIVDRVARRWGVDTNEAGKCVWFEIDDRAAVA